MATNAQRITALETAVKTLQARVAALEAANPPDAETPFTDDFSTDFGGTP